MRRLLIVAAFVGALTGGAVVSFGAEDFETIVTQAPLCVKAGKIEESVDLMLQLDTLVGRSILEKRRLARALQEMHNELSKREEEQWLYKLDEHARKLFPDEQNAGANLAEACITTGKFELAAKTSKAAAGQSNTYYDKSKQDVARVNLLLARASLVLGDIAEAKKAINAALGAEPSDARLYYTRAQVMMRAEEWEEVAKALKTAFNMDPDLAQPVDYLVHASCAQREGAYDQAEKILRQGLERFPTAPGLHYSLGQTFLGKRDEEDPDRGQTHIARAFYEFQYEIILSGPLSSYTDEAKDQIEIMTALLDREKDEDTYLKVAYGAAALMNMKPGGYEKAIENIKKGLRANGDDCLPLQALLGHAYANLGQYDQAAKAFETVLRIDPFFPPAYVDLGDTYEQLGEREKALEQYGKALTIDKHNWRVEEMLKKVERLK